LGGVVGRGGGGGVDGSSGVVVANEEPRVGGEVMGVAVGVSGGGGGVGSGSNGGRSSGWGSVRSRSSMGEGGDEIVGRGGLVLLDEAIKDAAKAGLAWNTFWKRAVWLVVGRRLLVVV
jgi:hypothetical protein